MRPKISIITVTFNAEALIKVTVDSVLSQSYTDFEYIFVDGCSTDRTNDIINEYKVALREKGINCIHISEKDKGIYDAMNKGTKLAQGEWIYFLNAGDQLQTCNVLENIEKYLESKYSVVYGGTEYVDDSGKILSIGKGAPVDVIPKHMPFCVQAAFVKTDIQKKYMYSLEYKICADYDFFLRLYKDMYTFRWVNLIVNKYLMGGFSSSNLFKTYIEVGKIQEEHGYLNRKSLIYILKMVRYYILCRLKNK